MLHRRPAWAFLVLCAVCATLFITACDDAPPPAPVTTTAAAASTADLRGICSNVCDRTTDCALEIAKRASRGYEDKPDVQRAMADEEKAARANLDACKKDCREQPIVDSDRAQLMEAATCLGQSDCAGFVTCFERIGTPAK